MKVIIAGMRDFIDYEVLLKVIDESTFKITQVVSGGCRGADRLGERFATNAGIRIKQYKPDWLKHGKSAGPKRNTEMASYADALIAIWDGKSTGTKDMISKALNNNLKIYIYRTDQQWLTTQ